ncbi:MULTISPECIES: HD domain-containing protein [Peptostreptococcus]|uniref:HD domain-containing protein n=1 Tax=Peptostreptococcus porci TaxID=2652282 RepID=A0A6N7XDS3_9FIRM|nr:MULTISPECIES: HD domain-containing protein [Peptostreptococcus]MDD7183162.1 HD domain-containing protein [Peptostreptococcus porci]MDY4127857.1 HD domain-containing protein [Peptostreptococcus porci]MDY5435225.1 HD domain-containing protein [Peptostreptococcus porci]MDY5964561.1 HD domain-containing protein [Peptostreptococcus porci]MDY6232377.1 HD domain-containing protein [Peptostreptococcus porci]
MSNYEILIDEILNEFEAGGEFLKLHDFIQHGDTTTYDHCIQVAKYSCQIATRFNLEVDYRAMIRGALLHDYFLYDWHDSEKDAKFHGFTHPYRALSNAKKDYKIGEIEENIIVRHMFPLTVIPPKNLESWLVCVADKICALSEASILIKAVHTYRKAKNIFGLY